MSGDILFLTGTGVKELANRDYHVDRTEDGGHLIHFGWKQSPFTNKKAGCAIYVSPKFQTQHIVAIEAATGASASISSSSLPIFKKPAAHVAPCGPHGPRKLRFVV